MSGPCVLAGRLLVCAWVLLGAGCATPRMPHHPSASRGCGPWAFLASHGQCVPNGWFCSPMYYNAGAEDGCDCDCGVPDPDCAHKPKTSWCYGGGMARPIDACALCGEVPGERALHKLQHRP